MRILAVDDDPIVLELLKGALTGDDMKCDLTCCASAEEAIEVMDADPEEFDCFLLDIMLPGIDGIELCDSIRQTVAYRSTPIIMITASRETDLMRRAFGAGATDFVTKPLNGLDLGARINTASMLNAAMQRERAVRDTLVRMSATRRAEFDTSVSLAAAGVTDLSSIENDLRNLPQGCYAMQLFTIEVEGLRDVYENVSAAAYHEHLETTAEAATRALTGHKIKLAYAGSGRFAGVVLGRPRIEPAEVEQAANAIMQNGWDTSRHEADLPPRLRFDLLSDQRLWTGTAASEHLAASLAAHPACDEVLETTYAMAAE